MSPADALKRVRSLGAACRFFITDHARERMKQRGVQPPDIQHGLANAATATWQTEHETWKVGSADLVGDDLTLAVRIETTLIVVTVF